MAKGKKFNAAEKHFEKRELEYKRKIKELEREIFLLRRDNLFLSNLMNLINKDSLDIIERDEEIMKLKDMSKEDVDSLVRVMKLQMTMEPIFTPLYKSIYNR